MGLEIERKFLVQPDIWDKLPKEKGEFYKQGYISTEPSKTIRVRLTEQSAFITIKGSSQGFSRMEFEYSILQEDAKQLLDNFCLNIISKIRYKILYQSHLWEVDVFLEDNEGLIIAEIELESETDLFELPSWIKEEVTTDERYYNSYLSQNPFQTWKNSI
ncbi:MAG: CYTH domain-containing protein [Raineya sp.]|jgi:CYTH domain-containing protein|nr:CYTH domain-containing protein [Raineya sp.]